MSSSDGERFLDRADGKSPTGALQDMLTAPILAVAAGLSGLVVAAFDAISGIRDVINAGWEFLIAVLTEPIQILEMSAQFTGMATEDFGIFAFAVGTAAIIAAFWIYEASGLGVPIVDQILPWR